MIIKSILFAALFTCFSQGLKAQVNVDIGVSREELEVAATYISELKAIYSRVGINASVIIVPNMRADGLLEKSNVDAIAIKTERYKERHADLLQINVPIYKNVNFKLYAMKSELSRVKKLDSPYIITAHGCLGCSEYVEKYKLNINTYQRDLKSCFNVLLKKRTDLALIPDVLLKKDHLKELVAFDDNVLTTSYYHYIHKRIAHLKPRIEEEFRRSVAKGGFIPKKIVKDK